MSWVEVALSSPADGQTLLELAHITLVADDDKWAQFGPGAVGVGWDMALAIGLSQHLRSGRPVDPEQARAWSTSDDGRRFVSLSADGWRHAQVAAGESGEQAQAAADRTEAFYTGAATPGGS